ncbi:hypothetical protein J6590_106925, partial [Homalodisca vitripennis]
TNDVDKGAPYSRTLQQAFQAIPNKWDARIVFVAIPDRFDKNVIGYLKRANDLLRSFVKGTNSEGRRRMSFCEMRGRFPRGLYTKHGLHLNEEGNLKLAELMRKTILDDVEVTTKRLGLAIREDESFDKCVDEKRSHLRLPERYRNTGTCLRIVRPSLCNAHRP